MSNIFQHCRITAYIRTNVYPFARFISVPVPSFIWIWTRMVFALKKFLVSRQNRNAYFIRCSRERERGKLFEVVENFNSNGTWRERLLSRCTHHPPRNTRGTEDSFVLRRREFGVKVASCPLRQLHPSSFFFFPSSSSPPFSPVRTDLTKKKKKNTERKDFFFRGRPDDRAKSTSPRRS